MYRIGVIGPLPSVERILEVASEFEHEIEFIPFSYEDAREEVRDIIERHQFEVNGWFFSGPIPYMVAKTVMNPETIMIYCPPTGLNLYKCLLEMFFDQQKVTYRFSIDMIHTENLYESLSELGISTEEIYVTTFDEDYDPKILSEYHMQLWNEGKIQGVLTCLNSVYLDLKKKQVPVYRIYMTKIEIRQAMRMVIEKVRSSYFKDRQIGVEIIEIDQFDQIAEKVKTRYHLQHLELKIKQTLLLFCEKLDGSLMDNGNGRYQIFSSRGAIEREIKTLRQTVRQLSIEMEIPVAVGIGYGETAFSAEINARRAIQHSKEKTDRDIVVVHEDGLIIESIGEEEEFSYLTRSSGNDKDLLDKLNKSTVSIKTYKKIEALVERKGWNYFTAQDLATYLSMTVRNAQRIMAQLCDIELAAFKGEEQYSTRGRPRRLYVLKKHSN